MATYTGDLIRKLKDSLHKTSVVVTHDTHLAKKLADRAVFLQEGRVGYFGPWSGFENSTEPYLRNFRLQDELSPELDAPPQRAGAPSARFGRRAGCDRSQFASR